MKNCCSIFVTYNPNLSVLQQAISATVAQVGRVYVIDNGSKVPFGHLLASFETVEGVFLRENKGIAAGLNVGIQLARKAGYKYVLLLDQDSIPPEGMVSRYLEVMEQQTAAAIPVAAIGPRYRDPRTDHISRFVRFNWFRNSYHGNDNDTPVVPADFLISSGSFYALGVFDQVGMFDEGFFIDHVDTEWCHRARSLGFRCFGAWDVVMDHCLGESRIRLWLFRWRNQPMHNPFRLYYIVRNSLLLYRMKHTPIKWISGDVIRLLRLAMIYVLFFPQRREAIVQMAHGFRDGIRGISGHAPSKK